MVFNPAGGLAALALPITGAGAGAGEHCEPAEACTGRVE